MKENVINLIGIRKRMVLSRIELPRSKKKILIIMSPITEQEEKDIDKAEKLTGAIYYKKADGKIVEAKNIYLYGEVDFTNKDDIALIKKFNLIDEEGAFIKTNFDFTNGNFTTVDKKSMDSITYNSLLWFKYCYCLIGKPTRIIVYKDINK